MVFIYNDKEYDVIVNKKNNKNTYIRVKDGCVSVSTNYFSTNRSIERLLRNNYSSIAKMIDKYENSIKKSKLFYLFGKNYNVIYGSSDFNIVDDNIYVKDSDSLNKWLKKYINTTFSIHLKYWYDRYEEDIPVPNLKIRKMKTRWGVCNKNLKKVTLNSELIYKDAKYLDYVIVHELSHFIEANHSSRFWKQVSKYYPNYKDIRKKLKD